MWRVLEPLRPLIRGDTPCAPAPGGVPKVMWRLRKSGKRRKERAGTPADTRRGPPPLPHLPLPGLTRWLAYRPGTPRGPRQRALTLGLAELVVVLQPVAGRAAAVAPARLLQAVVRAAAVFRRAVGEAHPLGRHGGRREGAAALRALPAPARGGPRPAASPPHRAGRSGPPSPRRSRSGSRPGRRCTCRARSTGGRTGSPEGRCASLVPVCDEG